jgi:hypothetical protein
MKTMLTAVGLGVAAIALAACDNDARVASYNISQDADNFKINRRIVFVNGITDKYMLVIEGFCSHEQSEKKLAVTCKTGNGQYKKHFLGLSDNVTYFSEQLDSANVSPNHYKIIFKPEVIIPTVEMR